MELLKFPAKKINNVRYVSTNLRVGYEVTRDCVISNNRNHDSKNIAMYVIN
jgi:hypothetical protein